MSFEIAAILKPVAFIFFEKLAVSGLDKLLKDSPVSQAIKNTHDQFTKDDIEGVSDALHKWCRSDDFSGILNAFKSGQGEVSDTDCVTSFLKVSGFFYGDVSNHVARQILKTFGGELEKYLLASEEGLSVIGERQSAFHHESLRRLESTQEVLIEKLSSLPEEIHSRIHREIPSDEVKTQANHEQPLHAKVDAARSLLKKGKPKSAQSLLEELRKEQSDKSFSVELQFRIATNLGACALELDDQATFDSEVEFALKLQPQNVKALGNAAGAAFLGNHLDRAIDLCEKARRIEPKDPHSTSILIQTYNKLEQTENLRHLLEQEEWIKSNSSCCLALALIAIQGKRFLEAEKYSRICIEHTTLEDKPHTLLASAIMGPIKHEYQKNLTLNWRISQSVIIRIEESLRHLTIAVQILSEHENSTRLHHALINRANVQAMLGKYEDAIKDLDRVLWQNELNQDALYSKGLLYLEKGDPREAINCLIKLPYHSSERSIALPLANAYLNSEQFDKAEDILSTFWDPSSKNPEQIKIALLSLPTYEKLHRPDKVQEIITTLIEDWSQQSEALAVLAHHEKRKSNFPKAIELLEKSLLLANEGQKDLILLELGEISYNQENYQKAAEYLKQVVDLASVNSPLKQYVVSLYYSKAYDNALTIAQNIRGSGPPLPIISEIEAKILEFIGDYKKSKEIYWNLLHEEPEQIRYKIEALRLEFLEGNAEEVKEKILSITLKDIGNDSEALMLAARMRTFLELEDALPFAFQARQIGFNNPKSHLSYLVVFHHRHMRDSAILDPEQITADCTVELRSLENGQIQVFTILKEESCYPQQNELTFSNPLAKILLGKQKGETVSLRQHDLENLSYEIVEVQSKYVFAFQETLKKFSTWFPNNLDLYQVTIANNDFSKIFKALDKRHAFVSQAMQLYREKSLTLGAFAKMIGTPLIDVWIGMVTRTDGLLYTSTGSPDEIKPQLLKGMEQQQPLVMDLTALLTQASLCHLDQLSSCFPKILISQSVLDELQEAIIANFGETGPSGVLCKDGDKYVHYEVTPQAKAEHKKFLENISIFVRKNAEVVPTVSALQMDSSEFKELKNTLGRSSLDSVLTAKQHDALFYSDDLLLRSIAKSDWQVTGVWSQPVLLSMYDKNVLTSAQYYDAIRKLALGNYHFISLNADAIMHVLEHNNWKPVEEVSKIFEMLKGPTCSENSAIVVLSELLRKVWIESLHINHKLWTLDLSLRALTAGRLGTRVIHKFKAAITQKFRLLPLDQNVILQQIDLWVAVA